MSLQGRERGLIAGFSPAKSDAMTKKILIVDDEVHVRMLLEQTLEELQDDGAVEISMAADGREAFEAIRREPPDLVLLDVMMPRMSGYEVCQAVAAQPDLRDVAIILLTAKGQEVDREQGLKLGALQYMTKPFDPDDILEMARDLLKL